MSKPWKVVVVGVAHMHVISLAHEFGEHPDFTLAAVADVPPSRPSLCDKSGTRPGNLRDMSERMNGNVYECWREMLDKEQPDIVICCSENSRHGEVITEALNRGIHVVAEKPMADSYADAKLMANAAKRTGARLIVNWPSTWWPQLRLAKELADTGAVGRVFRLFYRNGTSLGPYSYGQGLTDEEKAAEWWYRKADGGGAFLDYICYGANISRWFMGADAVSVQAMSANFDTPYAETEDYGALLAQYPNAAVILEASWTTTHTGVTNGPVVLGLEGALVVDGKDVKVYKDRHGSEPTEIHTPEPLPANRGNIALETAHCLRTGELHPTLDLPVNLGAMALLDAGLKSAASGNRVNLPTEYWM